MPYTLEQLAVLAQVARSGSFSSAARALGKAQSAVSSAIANLEIDLDVVLFDRSSKIPALTPAGQQLLREAEVVLACCRALEARADSLSRGLEPSLTLAIEVPFQPVAPVLEAFAAQFPEVDLDLRHPAQGDVSRLIESGDAQLGLAVAQLNYPQALSFCRLGALLMTHVVSPAHPLAAETLVDFHQLAMHRRLAFRAHRDSLPTTEYLSAGRSWQAESYPALIEMTKAGLGWASVPRQMIAMELAAGSLVELALRAYPNTDWDVGVDLLWRTDRGFSPAGSWLKERFQRLPAWRAARKG